MAKGNEALKKVVNNCTEQVAKNQRPVVVFDLDSTIFDNSPRMVHIFREFAKENLHLDLENGFKKLNNRKFPYGVEEILAFLGVKKNDDILRGKKFWKERFFTNEYQKHDKPALGSVEFINEIFDLGATVVYLTGRDVPQMLLGCTASLLNNGFPVGKPRTVTLLKPYFELADEIFKEQALDFVANLGNVVATFDNEPANCNLFYHKWPDAKHFWLDTNHSNNAPALKNGIDDLCHFMV
ncbi:hypothetical protein JYT19_00470 [Sulfobacillus acidophilus]|uniref:HAD family hydrolase n=1 Tax=Sulfobacillus acidophilus TaxID=53633 RepID=A0ABS3AW99_9FIRM|nr:hypothetical protein [Sulfobacillus acidophilus]